MKPGRLLLAVALWVAAIGSAVVDGPWWVIVPLVVSGCLCAWWWIHTGTKGELAREEAAHEGLVGRVVEKCADRLDTRANETRHFTRALYYREAADELRGAAGREAVTR